MELPFNFEEKNRKNEEYYRACLPELIKTEKTINSKGFNLPVYDARDYNFTFKTNPENPAPDPLVGTWNFQDEFPIFSGNICSGHIISWYYDKEIKKEEPKPKFYAVGPEVKDKLSLFEYQLWHDKQNKLKEELTF